MPYPDTPDSLLDLEAEVLQRWRDEDLFRETLRATADGDPFVFYEGPPTANGRPGFHHVIGRTVKDLFCRHRTMLGHRVTRIAGWDTHGLPVEIEAEKKLGISGKMEIEELGIDRFNEVCRDSVFTYKEEWEKLSERIGFWLDYDDPYVTFQSEYIDSVWWVLKELADRGLLYRGYKSVPYCPRCGTALSSHEVAQGYQDVEDPSLFFLCPLLTEEGGPDPEGRAFLAWTTTPWTVPANVALAVGPELTYAEVEVEGRRVILARTLVERVLGEDAEVLREYSADALVGTRYARPLELVPEPEDRGGAWTVYPEEFVTAEEGTGIVHIAPAFGADDHEMGQRRGLPMLRPIDDEGCFDEGLDVVGGRFVKDADPLLVDLLDEVGNLFRAGRYVHSYPHCWRCESPLIYLALDSWFAATSTLKDDLLENNRQVGWHPPEVGSGRFGEWLENNVDWALSRDRYWGTPIPVWVCQDDPDHVEWIGGLDELSEKAGGLPDDFDPHRPWIDEITWTCAECGGAMRRSPEVVDVWFDSGCMPYAQWHYPFENRDEFREHFPSDFICEGLDQTRGWFYSLMAISTMLDRGPAYRNVVVNGTILDSEGQKMSKSKGNAEDPWEAVERYGADVLRWYLVTSSHPWADKRYDPEGVGEAKRKFFDTLVNTYRFFALYAGTEGWEPSDADPPPEERGVLDRWLLSRLAGVTARVREELDAFEPTRAYRLLGDFLVEDVSNWYVRRSRDRFWGSADRPDARAAFRTLWDALRTVSLLAAPAIPFVSDWLHRALTGDPVHLAAFPEADDARIDGDLEDAMEVARTLVTLGRAAREEVQIRVRQPLRTLQAVVPGRTELDDEVLAVLKDELNVKEVEFLGSAEDLVRLTAKPNYASLGPRFQARTDDVANAIRKLSEERLKAFQEGETIHVSVEGRDHPLQDGDLEVLKEARGDLVVRSEGGFTVALDPELDDELRTEGLARELVNRIQRLRKEAGLEISDRISLGVFGPDEVQEAARSYGEFITGETLAVEMSVGTTPEGDGYLAEQDVDLDGRPARVALDRVTEPS